MKTPHSLIPEQKENIKHGEVYFPIQKYITNLTKEARAIGIVVHWTSVFVDIPSILAVERAELTS